MSLGRAIARAARRRGGARPAVRGESIPAPVKGWNARDPLFDMDAGYATRLDNYVPQTGHVSLRRGSAPHATGLGDRPVETLFAYRSGDRAHLLACAGGAIRDVTAAGEAGPALASGLASDRWQVANFAGRGILVNGRDAPLVYDGRTVRAAAFTGPSSLDGLAQVHPFKRRLLFLERDQASFRYGGIEAIAGGLEAYPLAAVHPGGGRALALGTMTVDGGAGIDDLLAIFMESGDVLVYAGTDPARAESFALIGIFHVGRVVGARPLVKLGPELVAITADGYIPLTPFLRSGRARRELAVSDRISGAVGEAVRRHGDSFGWQGILYPRANWLLFNVPKVAGRQAEQHVMNTQTGAWCRFTGMNASCWALHRDRLYFGGPEGRVFEADRGRDDDGAGIAGDVQSAHRYFGGKARLKRFTLFRPVAEADGRLSLSMGLGIDFARDIPTTGVATVEAPGTPWNAAPWGGFAWAGGLESQAAWHSADALGTAAAVRIRTRTAGLAVRLYATDVLFEPGGFV